MDRSILEVFPNPASERDYLITHHCPEFTSVCPMTGQPDFGTIVFEYVPDRVCVELKSLKFYLQGYRNEGIFYEAVINRLLDDFVAVCAPRRSVAYSSRPMEGCTLRAPGRRSSWRSVPARRSR